MKNKTRAEVVRSQRSARTHLAAVVAGGVLSALAVEAPFAADDASVSALQDVIVTARRREENLQNVPVSVVALTAEDLKAQQIRGLEDVGAGSANVMILPSSNAGNSAASIYIRGIGQFDEIITTDPGVGVYVDGVYLARTTGALLDIGDFQRVEVLRGPQGTLFGKNTIGGAINITTHRPDQDFNGYIDATYGRFGRIDARGAVNLPLADRLAARVSFSSRNAAGWARQGDGVKSGNDNTQGGRAQLRWTPNDDVELALSFDKTRIRERLEPRSLIYADPTAPIAAGFNFLGSLFGAGFEGASSFGPQYLSDDWRRNFATGENVSRLDAWGTSLNATWAISDTLTLASITAYRDQESRSALDGDTTPAIFIQFNEAIDQNQFSQEFQLRGSAFDKALDWVTGVIYFHEKATSVTDSFQVPDLRFFIGDTSRHDTMSIKNDTFGAFVEGTWHVTDKLNLTVGGRYTSEKKKWTHDLRQQYFGASLIPPGTESDKWSPFTPRLGIQFMPTADSMLYATVSRGFRSGGFNARATSAGVQSFDPEFVWTYEAGFKSQWADNRLRLNGSVFYNDYQDLQILIVTATPTGGFDIFTRNAAKAKTQGVELELLANPAAGLEFAASVGYLDAKVKKSDSPSIPSGNRLQASPKWSSKLSGQYTAPLGDTGDLSLRLDWIHKSKTYYNNENSEAIADDYSSVNARLAFASRSHWEVAAFVTNIANTHNAVGGFDAPAFGFGMVQWSRPREYGVSVGLSF